MIQSTISVTASYSLPLTVRTVIPVSEVNSKSENTASVKQPHILEEDDVISKFKLNSQGGRQRSKSELTFFKIITWYVTNPQQMSKCIPLLL